MKRTDRTPGIEAARLLQAVRTAWNGNCSGESVAVGLSGGMDSIVLSEALYRCGIPFVAFHFNHRWRGEQSLADAKWVKRWCAKRSIPCVTGLARKKGITSEGEARDKRWQFLLRSMKAKGIGYLWLAQHGDDLVETFLLQLLRGAGLEGLAGMQDVREREGVQVMRPLLDFNKAALADVAKSWKLDWREDASNADLAMFRNRVRRKLIPYLEKIAKRPVRDQLWRTARVIADENRYWESEMPAEWPKEAPVSIREKGVAWQRRYLRGWLKQHRVSDLGFELLERVRALLTEMTRAKVNLPGDRFCRRRNGKLWIEG